MKQGMIVNVMPGVYTDLQKGDQIVIDDIELGCVKEVLPDGRVKVVLEDGKNLKADRGQVCIAREETNSKGYVLVLGLLLTLLMSILAMGAMSAAIFDIKIASNRSQATQAFYNSESGWNIAMAKLSSDEIVDTATSDPNWSSTFNGTDFNVTVSHMVNGSNVVTKYGSPIYIVTSRGTRYEATQVTQIQIVKRPHINPRAALYAKGGISVKGTSTVIIGTDICGSVLLPGIITMSDVTVNGSPTIEGSPPIIEHSTENLSLTDMISYMKDFSTESYELTQDKVLTNQTYGELAGDPPVPTGNAEVVYFGGGKNVKLTSSSGAGILMVDGNLEISGGFTWYGIVIVTGDLKYTGGGEKLIIGVVMSGDTTEMDATISGNAVIKYCSSINDFLKVPKYKKVAWKQIKG